MKTSFPRSTRFSTKAVTLVLSFAPVLLVACGSASTEDASTESSALVAPLPPPCVIIGGQLKCFDAGLPYDAGPPPVCDPPCRGFEHCVDVQGKDVCLPLLPVGPQPLN
jgi:hypothetical protein